MWFVGAGSALQRSATDVRWEGGRSRRTEAWLAGCQGDVQVTGTWLINSLSDSRRGYVSDRLCVCLFVCYCVGRIIVYSDSCRHETFRVDGNSSQIMPNCLSVLAVLDQSRYYWNKKVKWKSYGFGKGMCVSVLFTRWHHSALPGDFPVAIVDTWTRLRMLCSLLLVHHSLDWLLALLWIFVTVYSASLV